MKRILCIASFIFLVTFVVFGAVFSCKSNIWQQDIVVENRQPWSKVKSGWTIRENLGNNNNGSITISRVFFVDEVHAMLGHENEKIKNAQNADIPDSIDWPTLFFITHNQNVRMYADDGSGDELVYSFGNNGTQIAGSESGNAIHCVSLPNVGRKDVIVTIQLSPSFDSESLRWNKFLYANTRVKVPEFYFGWRTTCITNYFRKCIVQLIPILLIYVLGFFALFFLIVSSIFKKTTLKQYWYWGVFAIDCATGFLLESYFGYFISNNSFLIYFLSTVFIALHPSMFLIYMREKMVISYSEKIATIFKVLSPLNILIVCVCAFIPLIPFTIIRYYVCIVLALFIVFMLVTTIYDSMSMGGKTNILNVVIIIAGVCFVLDFLIAIVRHQLSNVFVFSRYGMLVFYTTGAILVTEEVFDNEMARQRALGIEKSLYTDILTGCWTTAALWRDNKKLNREKTGFGLAIVSITNINEINEKEGTAVGDNAVWSVAQLLQNSFTKDMVYRLSGTKFCIMLSNQEINKYKEKMYEVERMLEAYNKKSTSMKVVIQSSAGIFNPAEDIDFDGIFIRVISAVREKSIQKNS